jgi:hypothetical protein
MNAPHFEVYPETRQGSEGSASSGKVSSRRVTIPTGKFGWRYQDANGKLTHVGGEGFDSRGNAHRSIVGVAYDYARLLGLTLDPAQRKVLVDSLPIVDPGF